MAPSLTINLANPAADERDYVLIEQEPWPEDVGRTSASQGAIAIGAMLFGGALPLPNCGGLGAFDTPVYVYPSRSDLHYLFNVSHGQFQSGVVEVLTREEMVQCSLQEDAELDYPVRSRISMQWIGPCYNENGQVVGRPIVKQIGRKLFFNKKVYGSIRVKYTVYRRTYNVCISSRQDAIENNFDCVAFCVWKGGLEHKEIEAPDGYGISFGNCGNGLYHPLINGDGSSTDVCQPDWGQGTYPKAVRADKLTKVDYCSQQILSEKITESEETGNTPGEECSDGSITTN